MKRGTISRRDLLKGLGAAGIVLPFFPSLHLAAEPTTYPKRLILFFSANGTIPTEWIPKGDENNFQFGRILQPLDPFKKKLMILRGLGLKPKGPATATNKAWDNSSQAQNSSRAIPRAVVILVPP